MSYTIEKINAEIEETFAQKYGVCIDGGMPQTATGLEALCHRVYNKGWADCRERILNDKWIPCSERLPEDDRTKLVTFDGIVDAGYYSDGNWWCIGDSINLEIRPDVIAWMPLPEPYELKGEVDETD